MASFYSCPMRSTSAILVPFVHPPPACSSQSGAMFGLDARIALGIFAVIALVSGAALMGGLETSRAKSLASELSDTGKAVEAVQYDLRDDLFTIAATPNETEAFRVLFDREAVREDGTYRGRWLGPYSTLTSSQHPRYGALSIEKHTENANYPCNPVDMCYQWVVYETVSLPIAREVNNILDSGHETNPEAEGRVQWRESDDTATLFYRASKAVTTDTP